MKKISLLLTALAFCLIINGAATGAVPSTLDVGDYFPPYSGTLIDGGEFNLLDNYNSGKYIFIDFWAYWCGPCKRAMPDVVKTFDEYGGDRFFVTGVNMDTPSTEAKMHDYLEEAGITFPCVTELAGWNTTISLERGIHYIPQNYLLAPDGTILFKDLHGEELTETVGKLIARKDIYKPIKMSTEVDHDPRLMKGFKGRADAWAAGIYTKPFAQPLNPTPDELRLRIKVDNPEEDHFKVIFSYNLYKPTGKRTYRVKDPVTREVYRPAADADPYIFYEADVETKEVIFDAWHGTFDSGFKLPLGDDVWEVSWQVKVFSKFLNREVTGGDDDIDFAGFYTLTPEMIADQGGIIYGKYALEKAKEKASEGSSS